MKTLLLTCLLVVAGLYSTTALAWGCASNVTASSVNYYNNGTCNPCWPLGQTQRHWLAYWPAGYDCNDNGRPDLDGSQLTEGQWNSAYYYQLTKGEMYSNGCLSGSLCNRCTTTNFECIASQFDAYCCW